MKKQRKVKCPTCGSFNDKENTVYYQKRYYCQICYENKIKESGDYRRLCEYICNIYEIEAPTGMMLKQIKDFKQQYNYTYKGMRTTLHYFYEIEKHEVKEGTGIGIIVNFYEIAKKFYLEKKKIKESTDTANVEEIIHKTKTININKNDIEDKKYEDIAIIDISKF